VCFIVHCHNYVCLTAVQEHIFDVEGRGVFGVAIHNSMIFFIQCECDWIDVYKASGPDYNFLRRVEVPGMTNPTDLLVFDKCPYIPDDMTSRTHHSGSDHCIWKIELSRALTPGSRPKSEEYSKKMLTSLGTWHPLSLSRTRDGMKIIVTAMTNKIYLWNPKTKNQIEIKVALPEDIRCSQHVIEMPHSFYLFCHSTRNHTRQVCRLFRKDDKMYLAESSPDVSYLNDPRHLAQLPNGKILVVDHLKNRILLMAGDLKSYEVLLCWKNGGKKRPCRLAYHKDSKLLVVAFHHHIGLYSLQIEA